MTDGWPSSCGLWASDPLRDYRRPLAALGISATCYLLLWAAVRSGLFLYQYLLLRFLSSSARDFGRWAVVTGGSSGIGRSYARQLAARGLDLVLVSDEVEALRQTAEEIRSRYGTRCCWLEADLTRDGAFRALKETLEGKEVGLLINNAGTAGRLPCSFLSETESNTLAMIRLHLSAVVRTVCLLLPPMLQRNRGGMVTVSSFSSLKPMPHLSIYSACKAASDRFTRALAFEYADTRVCLQSLIPSYISTRMIMFRNVALLIPSSDMFAAHAVKTIGVSHYTTGYWIHEILRAVLPLFPTTVWKFFILKSLMKVKKFFRLRR